MGSLRLESVSYRQALRDVSLTVEAGEAAGVLIPHKVERAAFLNICAGIEQPDTGTVTTRGRLIFARRDWGGIGGPTVVGQLMLPLLSIGHSARSADHTAIELLAKWGLVDWSGRQLSELEEHELAFLSLLRALAGKPDVLLLDDPTAGYGNQLVDEVRRLVRNAREDGAAVIVAASKVQPMTVTTSLYGLSEGELRGSALDAEIVTFPGVTA